VRRLALLVLGALLGAALLLGLHRDLPGWYVQAVPAWYARTVYPLEHASIIREAGRRNGVDPALVAAIVYAESGFREQAVSERGAVGLMQLLPSTAREIARLTGGERFVVADLRDPRVNVRYGTHYLANLLERYDGSQVEALAAYHAGPRNVDGWLADAESGDLAVADIRFADTRAYVRQVGALTDLYRRVYGAELGPAP